MMENSFDQTHAVSNAPESAALPLSDPASAAGTVTARPERRGSETRETILDSAARLFAEFGYYGASLRNISREAGISHPGMLHHFESKSDLLGGVIDRLEEQAQNALSRVDELSRHPHNLLRGLAEVESRIVV